MGPSTFCVIWPAFYLRRWKAKCWCTGLTNFLINMSQASRDHNIKNSFKELAKIVIKHLNEKPNLLLFGLRLQLQRLSLIPAPSGKVFPGQWDPCLLHKLIGTQSPCRAWLHYPLPKAREFFIQFHCLQKLLVWGRLRSIIKPKGSLGESVDLISFLNEDDIMEELRPVQFVHFKGS